jgi:hypothetical protein
MAGLFEASLQCHPPIPVAVGNGGNQPLAASGAAVAAGHGGIEMPRQIEAEREAMPLARPERA